MATKVIRGAWCSERGIRFWEEDDGDVRVDGSVSWADEGVSRSGAGLLTGVCCTLGLG